MSHEDERVTEPAGGRPAERFLVTGAHGCIGAWVVATLVGEGASVLAFDASEADHRLRLLLGEAELEALPKIRGDITRLDTVEATLDDHRITNVIHLAALQVPFCRANPPLGAEVNVVGTVNLLEAVARRADRMAPFVYASSIAAYDDVQEAGADGSPGQVPAPSTLYGVYKQATEGAANVYWREHGLPSVGLRPHTVYGPGRDQGLTSAPTVAMLAAAGGVPYEIPFGGSLQLQYAPDVAAAFLAASRGAGAGAAVHNLAGQVASVQDLIDAIEAVAPDTAGTITYEGDPLPFPPSVDPQSLRDQFGELEEASLRAGVEATISRFRGLIAQGLVTAPA